MTKGEGGKNLKKLMTSVINGPFNVFYPSLHGISMWMTVKIKSFVHGHQILTTKEMLIWGKVFPARIMTWVWNNKKPKHICMNWKVGRTTQSNSIDLLSTKLWKIGSFILFRKQDNAFEKFPCKIVCRLQIGMHFQFLKCLNIWPSKISYYIQCFLPF